MDKKTLGIILSVLGVVGGIIAYTRVTSLYGQMHTWSPPFDSFEIITIIIGAVSLLLLIIGIIYWRKAFQLLRVLFICGYLMKIVLTFVPSAEITQRGMFGFGEVQKQTYSLYDIIRLLGERGAFGWQLFFIVLFALKIVFVILAIRYPKRWVFISGASFYAFLLLWGFFTPSMEGIEYLLIPSILDYISSALVLLGFFVKPTSSVPQQV